MPSCINLSKTVLMKIIYIIICSLLLHSIGFGSDSLYVRKMTDTLASTTFMGRGYVRDGMNRAGKLIAGEMQRIGLEVQEQSFQYPVNTFGGAMSLAINGKKLQPGAQFLIWPGSKSLRAGGHLEQQDSITWINQQQAVVIKFVDKLTWSVSQMQGDQTLFYVLKSAVKSPANFSCHVEAFLDPAFKSKNIIGTIRGTKRPDSMIVFTAHYDHLGAMGTETFFPGANDNAGGVAMMLDLAAYYKKNPPLYTMQFIAFAGEEAGLVGSEYYVNHPVTDLALIRFLLNLDLVGNGEEGITVVNATLFPRAFSLLKQLNMEKELLVEINSRGKARNSDHYWFTEKEVPSFFIYTLGKRKAYHDVDDIPATVPFYEINDLEILLIAFIKKIMSGGLPANG